MKLYWGPHTCAIGIHVLLEEIGLPYETERIDISGGATRKPPLLAVNPKGKVPTLVHDDGSVLTGFAAIATWLARSNPGSGLLPAGPETEARAVEVMAHVKGTIHGQGFARMLMPAMSEPQDVVHGTLRLGQAAVKNQGRAMVEMEFAILDPELARHPYAAGNASRLPMPRCSRWSGGRRSRTSCCPSTSPPTSSGCSRDPPSARSGRCGAKAERRRSGTARGGLR